MKKQWYVYLLYCADRSLYCGITTDMDHRLRQHNGEIAGGARYTRGRRPVQLADCAPCLDKSEALRMERKIKALPRARKLSFLQELKTTFSA